MPASTRYLQQGARQPRSKSPNYTHQGEASYRPYNLQPTASLTQPYQATLLRQELDDTEQRGNRETCNHHEEVAEGERRNEFVQKTMSHETHKQTPLTLQPTDMYPCTPKVSTSYPITRRRVFSITNVVVVIV